MKQPVLVLITGVLVMACSLSGLQPVTQSSSTTAAPPLTAERVKNMQVQLVAGTRHDKVRLKDGQYRFGGDPLSGNVQSVDLISDVIASGDLDRDGANDAAALLVENYGGTGVFVSVIAILNAGGEPVQAGGVLIDDRAVPGELEIQDGRIVFRGKVHAPNDPACCPTLHVVETMGLAKAGLQLQRLTSTSLGGGLERQIQIESPANGAQVSAGPVQVNGTFTISPFENTFACRVVDATGKEWTSGPITVNAEMGQPGSFDSQVDLSMVPPGMLVRLEVIDINAADGSALALDSVELMIK